MDGVDPPDDTTPSSVFASGPPWAGLPTADESEDGPAVESAATMPGSAIVANQRPSDTARPPTLRACFALLTRGPLPLAPSDVVPMNDGPKTPSSESGISLHLCRPRPLGPPFAPTGAIAYDFWKRFSLACSSSMGSSRRATSPPGQARAARRGHPARVRRGSVRDGDVAGKDRCPDRGGHDRRVGQRRECGRGRPRRRALDPEQGERRPPLLRGNPVGRRGDHRRQPRRLQRRPLRPVGR